MPVSVLHDVLLSVLTFRTAAGCVAPQPQSGILDNSFLGSLDIAHVTMDLFLRVVIPVIGIQQRVPLVKRNSQMDFRQDSTVIDVGDAVFVLRLRFRLRVLGLWRHRIRLHFVRSAARQRNHQRRKKNQPKLSHCRNTTDEYAPRVTLVPFTLTVPLVAMALPSLSDVKFTVALPPEKLWTTSTF